MRCVAPCCQEVFFTLDRTKSSAFRVAFMIKIVSDVSAAHTRSTRSCWHVKLSLTFVSWMRHEPSFATTLEWVPCSPACSLASSVLHGYPSLVVAERRLPAADTGSHECRARWCPLRWQDASFWWRRRIQRESGDSSAPQHVPDVIWSYISCVRPYERCVQ